MSAQHTPAPWSGGKEISIRAVDQEALGYSIIFVNTDSAARKDVARANALLIAAAPDLLAACLSMLAERSGPAQLSNACMDARDAIAKATGSAA